MSEKTHEIDVHVLEGENGVVHVRTDENMESGLVDREFDKITANLGDIATGGNAPAEPPVRTSKTDVLKNDIYITDFRDGSAKPTKVHK